MPLTIHSARFVSLSDLLNDLPVTMEEINHGDWSTITWGDANRTLISTSRFKEELLSQIDVSEQETEILDTRLNKLPDDVYIDMES